MPSLLVIVRNSPSTLSEVRARSTQCVQLRMIDPADDCLVSMIKIKTVVTISNASPIIPDQTGFCVA